MTNETTDKLEDNYEGEGPQILALPDVQTPDYVDAETRDSIEKAYIESGAPIPRSYTLKPGTRLHTEALRLEKIRQEQLANENSIAGE